MTNAHGLVAKNVVNLHRETDTDSETVTQAIMGQPLIIEKDEGEWMYVQTWDTYRGWILSRWVSRDIRNPRRIAEVHTLFTDALKSPDIGGEIVTKLVITTTLEVLDEEGKLIHVKLTDGAEAWVKADDVEIRRSDDDRLPIEPTGAELVRTGKRFLGVPYLWGGTSPFGLDCSGFVQLTYKLNGMQLLRDAGIQATDPRAVPVEKHDLKAGDLVFFAGGEDKSRITHVGMDCGDGTFIHSTGRGTGVIVNSYGDPPFDANYWGARRMIG